MSDLRTEHAAREAESWARFAAALDRIPRDRWDGSEVLPGWTVKDLLWHMAWWLDKCARNLEHLRTGTGEAAWPAETVDEVNAKLVAEAEGKMVDAVYEELLASRRLVRTRWEALPDVDAKAVEEVAGETYEHYDEHLPDLERFAG
jgi:uncharacterized damage-inducible protein DinB